MEGYILVLFVAFRLKSVIWVENLAIFGKTSPTDYFLVWSVLKIYPVGIFWLMIVLQTSTPGHMTHKTNK